MRAVWVILAICAAAASLGLLATGQLIWASSEMSYYLQLSAGVLLILAIFLVARRSNKTRASIVVLGSAALVALMPLDLALATFGASGTGQPIEGEVIGPSASIGDYLLASGALWLIHTALIAGFALGVRRSAR